MFIEEKEMYWPYGPVHGNLEERTLTTKHEGGDLLLLLRAARRRTFKEAIFITILPMTDCRGYQAYRTENPTRWPI